MSNERQTIGKNLHLISLQWEAIEGFQAENGMIRFTLFKKYLILFLETGGRREKEGEKHRCARDTSISCLSHPQLGPGPQPTFVP